MTYEEAHSAMLLAQQVRVLGYRNLRGYIHGLTITSDARGMVDYEATVRMVNDVGAPIGDFRSQVLSISSLELSVELSDVEISPNPVVSAPASVTHGASLTRGKRKMRI